MKIAVSNIAWLNEEDEEVANELKDLGVKYIEIAPTKTWPDLKKVSQQDVDDLKRFWKSHGLEIVAFQSVLFNRPDLKVFSDKDNRRETLEYLKVVVDIAKMMGVKRIVFGSPKNRQRGAMPEDQAFKIAEDFFREIAVYSGAKGVIFCIEPNAKDYACDFVTNANEGAELVRAINNSGFGLHLDTACMSLEADDLAGSIKANSDIIKHFHISAPQLGLVGPDNNIDHSAAAGALRSSSYDGFVSIEMRPGEAGDNSARVRQAVSFARLFYAD